MTEYDDNNKGACWTADKAWSVQAEIDNRKFYGVLVRSEAKSDSAPSHNLYLRAHGEKSEVYCVAIFKSDGKNEKLAGGELKLRSGGEFWVALFKNKSDHERTPAIDLSFQAKEAQPQQTSTQTNDGVPDGDWF